VKNKYSKITLCAHIDGELLEKVSSKISQDLVENAESVKFLEEIAEIDNHFNAATPVVISEKTKERIFREAFNLLDKKRAPQKEKIQSIDLKIFKIREIFNNISLELQFSTVALMILISGTLLIGRGKIIPGKFEAFKVETTIYSYQEIDNNVEDKNDLNDTSEEI